MSHLDEGQLHAYLDGEPHDGVTAQRHEIDQHLAECAQCRGRLDEERRVRDRAAAILRTGGPGDAVAPPFEELAARQRRTRHRVPRDLVLAWAATVALALGIGWYARSLALRDAPAALDLAVQEPRPTPAPEQPPPAASEAVPLPTAPAEARPEAGAATGRARAAPAERAQVAGRETPGATVAMRQADSGTAADDAQVAAAETKRNTRDLAALAVERAPAPAAQVPPAVAPTIERARAAEPPGLDSIGVSGAAAGWVPVDRAEAERRLNDLLAALPGLETIAVTAREADVPQVRTVQRLPDGRTIELLQERIVQAEAREGVMRRQRTDPGAQAVMPDRAAVPVPATAAMEWSNSRVTARAPLPPDSLRALLRQLRRAQPPEPDQLRHD